MPLTTGTRLGPYEVVSPIGKGGMGEVYKAKDTRLDRIVAIKVLPEHLAESPERKARFEREAKAISQLNHPHICTLYDVGEQDGIDYLVMEYIEGETLAERLKKGALPLDKALEYGIQIADGLDSAHRAGIVHRDLKPGNAMLTKSGIKLLDFGLAKVLEDEAEPGASDALTRQRDLTKENAIIGTLQYMAPEQLESKEVDARTDLFAFGAVLYEMLTGKKAFHGDSQASLIGAILKDEPSPISSLRSLSPSLLDAIVSTCLAKDPEERWRSAGDVGRQLKWIRSHATTLSTTTPRPAFASRSLLLVTAVAVALAAGIVGRSLNPSESLLRESGRFLELSMTPPADITFAAGQPPVISPDARSVAFVGIDVTETRMLWVRKLEDRSPRPLLGTDGATWPFWAFDSRSLGFFAGGKLKRIDLAGGAPTVLADAADARGGAWNRDGVILFSPSSDRALLAVPASGGATQAIVTTGSERCDGLHRWPQFLGDGRRFIAFALSPHPECRGIYRGSLDSNEARLVLNTDSHGRYVEPGYLVFVEQASLMAQRVEGPEMAAAGEPVRLVTDVGDNELVLRGLFSVSDDGVLVYSSGATTEQLAWFDRAGNMEPVVGSPGPVRDPALSPSETQVAFAGRSAGAGLADIWLLDIAREVPLRVTFDPSFHFFPVWSPDGLQILFSANRDGRSQIYVTELDDSNSKDAELVFASDDDSYASDWSQDGRFVAYSTGSMAGGDLWAIPLTGERQPIEVATSDFIEGDGRFSPDGNWIAFVSNESGRSEVYVQAFPNGGRKVRISVDGGSQPRWRGDGRELFYLDAKRRLLAVPVDVDSAGVVTGQPEVLFQTRPDVAGYADYDVTQDGERFLMVASSGVVRSYAFHIDWNWLPDTRR